jgi:hypothetical protein
MRTLFPLSLSPPSSLPPLPFHHRITQQEDPHPDAGTLILVFASRTVRIKFFPFKLLRLRFSVIAAQNTQRFLYSGFYS